MSEDDFLRPDVPPDDEERIDALDDAAEADDVPGIEGEEHLGLTPPG